MKHIYDYVAERDPYRVIRTCSRGDDTYIDCADWVETHPYINPRTVDGRRVYGREMNTLGSYVDAIAKLNRPDKCIGFINSMYSGFGEYPTFAELVCNTWAGMIHGAKTLAAYAYHDLGDRPSVYEGARYVFSSVEALEDLLLHGKRTLLDRTEDYEAVSYEYKKDKIFILVNFRQDPIKVKLKNLSGRFVEFRGKRTFKKFSFELAAHEVIIGTNRKMDDNLPSYADTQKLIDKLESERVSRGNLLFGRNKEMIVSTSPASNSHKKMFDGTTDVYAWSSRRKNGWYEIAFPEDAPTFSKINIFGSNIGGAKVQKRKGGEWISLDPEKTDKGEYSLSFDYSEPQRTVKLRIEFPRERVELYEIELLK